MANPTETGPGPLGRVGATLEEVLDRRVTELLDWLRENAAEIPVEQRHLDADTPERAYWHHGYMAALRDVRNCLAGKNRRLS